MVFNRIWKLIIFTFILFLMTACSSENMEEAMREVESTDLSNERIDDIKLGMSINGESFSMEHENFKPHPDNEQYVIQRNYDQY